VIIWRKKGELSGKSSAEIDLLVGRLSEKISQGCGYRGFAEKKDSLGQRHEEETKKENWWNHAKQLLERNESFYTYMRKIGRNRSDELLKEGKYGYGALLYQQDKDKFNKRPIIIFDAKLNTGALPEVRLPSKHNK